MRIMDEEARKLILESYLEENALFMLKTDRQTFLSRILNISDDEVAVSCPIEDYPLPDMTVEMHFHDEWGWYSFKSVVKAAPDLGNPRMTLARPMTPERFIHRKFTRIAVNLDARYGPLGGARHRGARICDLSVGGVLLQTEERLKPEEKIEIELSLPDAELPALVAVPCREIEMTDETPPFYTGCQFIGLSADTMQGVRDYVWRQLKMGAS